MPRKAIVGTRAAYERCGSCGHPRIRHWPGIGSCIDVNYVPQLPDANGKTYRVALCHCVRFTTERTLDSCP